MSEQATITRPDMQAGVNGYIFNWPELGLNVSVERLDDEGYGEVTFRHTGGRGPVTLHRAKTNLLSTTVLSQLANRLRKHLAVDWDAILTYISCMTIDELRRGEKAITIGLGDDLPPRDYLVNPLLPEGEATVIYGEPKSGKSYVSLLICLGLILPWRDNPFGWRVPAKPLKPLLLDWESGPRTLDRRLKRLTRGMDTGQVSLQYRQCSAPLLNDVDNVRKVVAENSPDVLIIDSIGMASGGDLNSPDSAKGLWRAIRELHVATVLLIGHSAKNMTGRTSIFGSQFYTAEARNIWEAKRVQETGQDHIDVGLFHRSANDDRLHRPIGLRIAFSADATTASPSDVRDVNGLSEELPAHTRIARLLESAPMKSSAVAKELGFTTDTAHKALTRHPDKFIKTGEFWANRAMVDTLPEHGNGSYLSFQLCTGQHGGYINTPVVPVKGENSFLRDHDLSGRSNLLPIFQEIPRLLPPHHHRSSAHGLGMTAPSSYSHRYEIASPPDCDRDGSQ